MLQCQPQIHRIRAVQCPPPRFAAFPLTKNTRGTLRSGLGARPSGSLAAPGSKRCVPWMLLGVTLRARTVSFRFLFGPMLQGTGHLPQKLDHGWPESRTSQARSAQRCRMRSFSLHEAFVKQARDSTRQGALRKLVGASWSAQVALRKLHCASCSAQVAPRKLLRQVGPCKWLPASCSVQIALPASCSVQAALCKLLCASCSA